MDPSCEGGGMKRGNFKKYGPVATEESWTHQHPNAPGREIGALEQALKKLEFAQMEQAKALCATLDLDRAEREYKSKKSGEKKYKSVPGFMVDRETGRELSPEEFLSMRSEILTRYGYYLKKRAEGQKGQPFPMKLKSAPVEEFAVECAPWVAMALEDADKAGHNVLPIVDEIFSGVAEEFERVTGFHVRFRARHPDEGILHEQLLWVKTDGEGQKLGLRPKSTHWWDIQFLYPAMLGARRWMNLVGREYLGEEKAKGIDEAMAKRKKQSRGIFPVPPDVALADYVDQRTDGLRKSFPWFGSFLDAATAQYRQRVLTLVERGKELSEAVVEVGADPVSPERDAPASPLGFSIRDENLLPALKTLMASLLKGEKPDKLGMLLLAKDISKPTGLKVSDDAKAAVVRCLNLPAVAKVAADLMAMAEAYEVCWERVVAGLSKLSVGGALTAEESMYFSGGLPSPRTKELAAVGSKAGWLAATEALAAIEARQIIDAKKAPDQVRHLSAPRGSDRSS